MTDEHARWACPRCLGGTEIYGYFCADCERTRGLDWTLNDFGDIVEWDYTCPECGHNLPVDDSLEADDGRLVCQDCLDNLLAGVA